MMRAGVCMSRALFEPSDKKEIDGILDVKAARPTTIDEVPEGTKIHRTLTIRSLKKNGPKKGQAKSRVVLDGSAMDCEHTHSPTLQYVSLRALLAVAEARKAHVE